MTTYKVNIINGDSYDIHDNTGCTMNFGGKKKEREEEFADYEEVDDEVPSSKDCDDDAIIEELRGIFYGNKSNVCDFLNKIRSMKDTEICKYVKELVNETIISELSCRKDLWEILYNHRLYRAGYRNWLKQVE